MATGNSTGARVIDSLYPTSKGSSICSSSRGTFPFQVTDRPIQDGAMMCPVLYQKASSHVVYLQSSCSQA